LKVEMAAGSEPPHIRALLDKLRPLSVGLSLCGAGAGGFAVIVLKRGLTRENLEEAVRTINAAELSADQLSVHTVAVSHEGIKSIILHGQHAEGCSVEQYLRTQLLG
jgi:hypothetical protein